MIFSASPPKPFIVELTYRVHGQVLISKGIFVRNLFLSLSKSLYSKSLYAKNSYPHRFNSEFQATLGGLTGVS